MTSSAPRTPSTGQIDLQSDLEARIMAARIRISFGPIPQSVYSAAGLAVIIGWLLWMTSPEALPPQAWAWLIVTFTLSMLFASHGLAFLLMKRHRHQAHWFRAHVAFTAVVSVAWSLALWALPVKDNPGLEFSLMAALVGIATTGSSLLVAFRWLSRLWALPLLLAISLHAIERGDAFGWFWLMFILGIVGVLWRHSISKERHIKEMLTFRYASEDMVAARNRALDEAHSLSETKTRFLATMSHEMRTPLHGVLGLARMLADEKLSLQGQKRLELLKSTGEHLLTIINDILDFSRLQARHLQLHPEATDVADLAQRALSLAAVTARDKPVKLELDCQLPQDARWMVDPARLRQILLNLLGNAVKFTNEGHIRLTVRLRADPRAGSTQDTLTFDVEDTGVGIPPEHLSRIFDAFHQAGNHAAVRAGTGLGLSIARQLCTDMGGDLSCESTVGTGSRFSVVLRLHRTAASTSHADAASTPASQDDTRRWSHVHALVVDDNPVNLIVTEAQLQRLGITVTCQSSAQAALDWLSKNTASIVLMDCHMPDMDGFEATVALRSRASSPGHAVQVVALTASDEASVRDQALRAGMQGILSKPFTDEALLVVLNQVLPKAI